MTKLLLAAAAAITLTPAVASAQSVFDGTWKIDAKASHVPTRPDVYLLQGGVFACKSCVPPYEVKADGAMHPVTGNPYFDAAKITVVNAHTVKAERMKGSRITGRATDTVSADGDKLTVAFDDLTVPSSPITGTYTATRVAPAPAGASPISGSWRQDGLGEMSANALLVTLEMKDGMLHLSTPAGQSYVAKLGGPQAPYKGDPGTTTVSVRSSGPHELTETDFRNGKPITVTKMTVAPDGRTMTAAVDDKLHGATSEYTLIKQ